MAADGDKSPSTATRRVLLGCLGIPALLIFVALLGLVFWYQSEMRKARRELATELKFMEERGSPLTSLDLDASYRVDSQREDITAELLMVLALAEDAQLKALAVNLPIVGNAMDPPPPGTDWAQLEEVEAYLAKHQALLDFAATLPKRQWTVRYPVDLTLGPYTLLTHVQQVRHAARLLQLQWHVDLHRDRPAEAVNRILEVFELADTLAEEPLMVSQLVRCALQNITLQMTEQTLLHSDVSEADLIRLQAALRKYDGKQAWKRAIDGERAMVYTMSSVPLSKLNQQSAMTRDEVQRFAGKPPVRPHDAALTLRNFRRMEIAVDESLEQAMATSNEIDAELKLLAAQPVQRLIHMQSLLMLPAAGSGVQATAQTDAGMKAADVGIAAIRFRRTNQVWPQQLTQLVPEFLPTVPLDPFDSQPLRIVVGDGEFNVYSIGKDQIDQGGDLARPQPKDHGFVAPWREVK